MYFWTHKRGGDLELQMVNLEAPCTTNGSNTVPTPLCPTFIVDGRDMCSGLYPVVHPGHLVRVAVRFGLGNKPGLQPLRSQLLLRRRRGKVVKMMSPTHIILRVHEIGTVIPPGHNTFLAADAVTRLAPAADSFRLGKKLYEVNSTIRTRSWLVALNLLRCDGTAWASSYSVLGHRMPARTTPCFCVYCGNSPLLSSSSATLNSSLIDSPSAFATRMLSFTTNDVVVLCSVQRLLLPSNACSSRPIIVLDPLCYLISPSVLRFPC